jgi:hypothetical protein
VRAPEVTRTAAAILCILVAAAAVAVRVYLTIDKVAEARRRTWWS